MDGKGFNRYVEAGDIVSAGQPILSFDDEAIKAAGHDDVVTCVVSNPPPPVSPSSPLTTRPSRPPAMTTS